VIECFVTGLSARVSVTQVAVESADTSYILITQSLHWRLTTTPLWTGVPAADRSSSTSSALRVMAGAVKFKMVTISGVTRGVWGFKHPPPHEIAKALHNRAKLNLIA